MTTIREPRRWNRFAPFVGMVLIALATSGAWAQTGKGNGRMDREREPRQTWQQDQGQDRNGGRQWTQQDRDQLRRDIRDYGRDVYGDRDRGGNRNSDRRPQGQERTRR